MKDFNFFTIGKPLEPHDSLPFPDRKIVISHEPVSFETDSPGTLAVMFEETTEVFGAVSESLLPAENTEVKFWISGNFAGRVSETGGTTLKLTLAPGGYLFETQTTDGKSINSYWNFQPSISGNVK